MLLRRGSHAGVWWIRRRLLRQTGGLAPDDLRLMYDHHDAEGFITLFGLPLKVRAMKMQEVAKTNFNSKIQGMVSQMQAGKDFNK